MKTITSMNFSEAVHASPHLILRAPWHIINIEDRDKDGYTALHHVASQSYFSLELTQVLLEKGANPNAYTPWGDILAHILTFFL